MSKKIKITTLKSAAETQAKQNLALGGPAITCSRSVLGFNDTLRIVANNWLQRPSSAISGWEYKFDQAEWSMKWGISNSEPQLFFSLSLSLKNKLTGWSLTVAVR